jgi:3-hydroxyisobutyrate dehydrogenase
MNISYLGMGAMGTPMAINLKKAQYEVTIWNRSFNKPSVQHAIQEGCLPAKTLEIATKNADVIISCLGDESDVYAVLLGENSVATFAKPNALIIDMSTIGVKVAKQINTELNTQGFRFLDAPVSGGDIGARAGSLTIMSGGDKADFDEAYPLFLSLGKNINYCGKSGSGQAVKLVNQSLAAIHMIALSEALKLAEQLGVSGQQIVDICSTGAAGSWALSNLGPTILGKDFNPGFMIKHMQKDLRLIFESIDNDDSQFPGINLADKLFKNVVDTVKNGEELGTQAMFLSQTSKPDEYPLNSPE